MTEFERSIDIIFGRLRSYENDPGYGYRMFQLPGEDQARIFRLTRAEMKHMASRNIKVPTKGLFVAAAMHPELKQLCLAYSQFPQPGVASVIHHALAYDIRELSKGIKHVVDYLVRGTVPQADGEFQTAGQEG